MTVAPGSIAELVEAVRSTPHLLPVGASTKPRLTARNGATVPLSLTGLSGILEYDPSEFTFTALAGTPVKEIATALAERGQYLPFDPPLAEAGATLGGTLAAGLSGPGRLRFGGVRDFVLCARFVDGAGRLLMLGGKVVKNAAGFDLPKFFVGSLGRFGVLAELTFKVFPLPASRLTLKLSVASLADASRIVLEAARSRWEPEALDVPPGATSVYLRLAGPAKALSEISKEILARWRGEALSTDAADSLWSDIVEFRWAHSKGAWAKVPLTPNLMSSLADLAAGLNEARLHVSAAGNVAFISLPSAAQLNTLSEGLGQLGLSGLTLKGEGPLWLGKHAQPAVAGAIKQALDPHHRFPSLAE